MKRTIFIALFMLAAVAICAAGCDDKCNPFNCSPAEPDLVARQANETIYDTPGSGRDVLIALDDTAYQEGAYVLASGGSSSELYYEYYGSRDGKVFVRAKIETEYTRVVFDATNKRPWVDIKCADPGVYRWYCEHTFHIPPGSLKRQIVLDNQ